MKHYAALLIKTTKTIFLLSLSLRAMGAGSPQTRTGSEYAALLSAPGEGGEWEAQQFIQTLPQLLVELDHIQFEDTLATILEILGTQLQDNDTLSRGLYLAAALQQALGLKDITTQRQAQIFEAISLPRRAGAIANACATLVTCSNTELTSNEIIGFSMVVYCASCSSLAEYLASAEDVTAKAVDWFKRHQPLGENHLRLLALQKVLLTATQKWPGSLSIDNIYRIRERALQGLRSGNEELRTDSDVFLFYMCFNILRVLLQSCPNQLGTLTITIDEATAKALAVLSVFPWLDRTTRPSADINFVQADIIAFLTAVVRTVPHHLNGATRGNIRIFAHDLAVKQHWDTGVSNVHEELVAAVTQAGL